MRVPDIDCEQHHPGLAVPDVPAAVEFYTSKLGFRFVASPHTKQTLAHIQELKKKHGIDYDSHASYRWVE